LPRIGHCQENRYNAEIKVVVTATRSLDHRHRAVIAKRSLDAN